MIRLLLPLAILALVVHVPPTARSGPVDDLMQACVDLDLPDPADEACLRQGDGDAPGDASDFCSDPSPPVSIGQPVVGWLAPPEDPEDNYALDVPTGDLDLVLSIVSQPAVGGDAPVHSVTVYAPSGASLCVTDLGTATPGSPLSFTADDAGTYTLRVQPAVVEGTLDPPPTTMSCHMICFLEDRTGYEVNVDPGP